MSTVVVSIQVDVDPLDAFEVFTQEIDLWWQRGSVFRSGARGGGSMRFENRSRLVEEIRPGEFFEIGHVSVWTPGERLVFGFRTPAFDVDQNTEVEVRFEAMGGGTKVSVEHRGFESIPPGHRVRHGLEDRAFLVLRGRWWQSLVASLKRHAQNRAV